MIYTARKDKNEVLLASKKRGIGAQKMSRKKQQLFKQVLDELEFEKKRKW